MKGRRFKVAIAVTFACVSFIALCGLALRSYLGSSDDYVRSTLPGLLETWNRESLRMELSRDHFTDEDVDHIAKVGAATLGSLKSYVLQRPTYSSTRIGGKSTLRMCYAISAHFEKGGSRGLMFYIARDNGRWQIVDFDVDVPPTGNNLFRPLPASVFSPPPQPVKEAKEYGLMKGPDPKDRELINAYFDQLPRRNGQIDLKALPEPGQIVVKLWTAEGIIGNGGLRYFFESDFEDGTPHSGLVPAYEAIGAEDCAGALRTALALFPNGIPQSDLKARNDLLDELDSDDGPLKALDTVFFNAKDRNVGLIANHLRAHKLMGSR